ncbi:hypothetical protein AOY57_04840 [Escherichia coli]|nr:hypothetical protein AOY57_04840 [Escherichia coli]
MSGLILFLSSGGSLLIKDAEYPDINAYLATIFMSDTGSLFLGHYFLPSWHLHFPVTWYYVWGGCYWQRFI